MGDVVSLDGVRAKKRPGPVPSFDQIMDRLFEALDLMEQVRGTDEVHAVVCEAIEMALTREERILAWTRK